VSKTPSAAEARVEILGKIFVKHKFLIGLWINLILNSLREFQWE